MSFACKFIARVRINDTVELEMESKVLLLCLDGEFAGKMSAFKFVCRM